MGNWGQLGGTCVIEWVWDLVRMLVCGSVGIIGERLGRGMNWCVCGVKEGLNGCLGVKIGSKLGHFGH